MFHVRRGKMHAGSQTKNVLPGTTAEQQEVRWWHSECFADLALAVSLSCKRENIPSVPHLSLKTQLIEFPRRKSAFKKTLSKMPFTCLQWNESMSKYLVWITFHPSASSRPSAPSLPQRPTHLSITKTVQKTTKASICFSPEERN